MSTIDTLLAVTAEDGRYHQITKEISPYVSEFGLMKYRVQAECAYLLLLSDHGSIRPLTKTERRFLEKLPTRMHLKDGHVIEEIERETKHDVNAMIRWLKMKCSSNSLFDVVEMVHCMLTSEDINNVAYRLQIKQTNNRVIMPRLRQVLLTLSDMAEKYCQIPMLARTHGQAAIPTTVGKELANFLARLLKEYVKLGDFCFTAKLNGAVGNYNAHYFLEPQIDWVSFSEKYARLLGFEPNLMTTQINPADDVIEYFKILERINNIMIDLAQDCWRYISDDWFKQAVVGKEVGSSTMSQKVNPIDFENAEGNFGVADALINFFGNKLAISRLQRDLSDSTVMRRIGTVMSGCLIGFVKINVGLKKITPNESVISEVLDRNWAVLSEPVQLVLRKETDLIDPYTLVKEFVRGKSITSLEYLLWINGLPISDQIKEKLRQLTPHKYIGLASDLTKKMLDLAKKILKF